MMVFTGVFIAFAGGFILLDWYADPAFLDFQFFGKNMRDLFQVQTITLSVAVWVGFLALFGIATDDGVLVATFLKDSFEKNKPNSIQEIRDAVIEGGKRRVRPAMMTTATTILALLPILTSTGRGSDIMLPMAIPSFGGMLFQVITLSIVFASIILSKFIVDKDLNQRGRLDDRTDGEISKKLAPYMLSSYDCIEVAEIKNKMSDDLRILFTEYRQKRKGDFNSDTRRANDLNNNHEEN